MAIAIAATIGGLLSAWYIGLAGLFKLASLRETTQRLTALLHLPFRVALPAMLGLSLAQLLWCIAVVTNGVHLRWASGADGVFLVVGSAFSLRDSTTDGCLCFGTQSFGRASARNAVTMDAAISAVAIVSAVIPSTGHMVTGRLTTTVAGLLLAGFCVLARMLWGFLRNTAEVHP